MVVALLIILIAIWLRFGAIKCIVNNNGKYDYVLVTDSIYPIRYQLILTDSFNRKQYFFVAQNAHISCDEFIDAEIQISTKNSPIYGVFVRPACLRQYNVNANILIGSGENIANIRLLGGWRMSELYNPHLFARADKFVESPEFTLLKYMFNYFLPIALIVFVYNFVVALRSFFKK